MILAETELLNRLADLKVETDNPSFPFDAAQVQSCSIDLRISDLFWKPRGRKKIDLSDATPLGHQVTRSFKRMRLQYPAGLKMKPGDFILARTYEKFEIPVDLMGRLVGRSSFGRLGISVAGQSNLINPGWSGRMPLIIKNESPFDIVVQPYIGVVQLCLFKLSSVPKKIYGIEGVGSKYVDDDGGPSRYWLDQTITDLRAKASGAGATPESQKRLENFSHELDEPTRQRFSNFVARYGAVTDISHLFDRFCASERRRNGWVWLVTFVLGLPIAVLTGWLPQMWGAGLPAQLVAGGLAFAVVVIGGWVLRAHVGTTLSAGELHRMALQAQA